jgi:hypothetical protein
MYCSKFQVKLSFSSERKGSVYCKKATFKDMGVEIFALKKRKAPIIKRFC